MGCEGKLDAERKFFIEATSRESNIHHSTIEIVPFSKGLRSHPTLSDDDFYNTPKMICHEKVVQPLEFSMKNMTSNNLF